MTWCLHFKCKLKLNYLRPCYMTLKATLWSVGPLVRQFPSLCLSQLTLEAFFCIFHNFELGNGDHLFKGHFTNSSLSVCLSHLLWRCQYMRLRSNDLVIVIAGSIFEVSRWAQLLKKFLCLKILHFAEWTILEFYMFLSV